MRQFINIVEAISTDVLAFKPDIYVYNIEWELDFSRDDAEDDESFYNMIDSFLQENGLPDHLTIKGDVYGPFVDNEDELEDFITEYLSDKYGYCTIAYHYRQASSLDEAIQPNVLDYRPKLRVYDINWMSDDPALPTEVMLPVSDKIRVRVQQNTALADYDLMIYVAEKLEEQYGAEVDTFEYDTVDPETGEGTLA